MNAGDTWDQFREDSETIGITEFSSLDLSKMPDDVVIHLIDNYFPDVQVSRVGSELRCRIEEHIYTKYWEHKYSGYSFSDAMIRAVLRLADEGHPFSEPEKDDEDVHIFVRWTLALPSNMPPSEIIDSVKGSFDLVWRRADDILENSDSVLVLGKDTGDSLERLRDIAKVLEDKGYIAYIIKDQKDKLGEGVIQKVMRYALSSKFVLIENTEPSGHLYEIPHVAKSAECITAVLQEDGKGATWMFEDAYAKHKHWHKQLYQAADLHQGVLDAIAWAETFFKTYGKYQIENLPWMKG